MERTDPIEDRNLTEIAPLVCPRLVKEHHPLTDAAASVVLDTRRGIRDVLHGRDRRRMARRFRAAGPGRIRRARAASMKYSLDSRFPDAYANTSRITFPATSVRRKSRPLKR